mgnify:CR=1 FL=1
MSDGGSISDIRKRTRTEEADDPVSVFLSGNDLFDFGRNVVGSNVWFPNSYFFGCGRDVHAAACIFEQKPAKTVHEFFIEQSYLFLPTAGYAMEHRREEFTAEDQETVAQILEAQANDENCIDENGNLISKESPETAQNVQRREKRHFLLSICLLRG